VAQNSGTIVTSPQFMHCGSTVGLKLTKPIHQQNTIRSQLAMCWDGSLMGKVFLPWKTPKKNHPINPKRWRHCSLKQSA